MTATSIAPLPPTWWQRSTRAFRNRNYRTYFLAQMPLVVGSWIHSIALGWLMWRLSSSPWMLGLIALCDTGPLFFLSPFTGTLIDRIKRRTVLIITFSCFVVLTMTLAILTITNTITIELLFVIALLMGICQAFDSPARQTILPELVDREDLSNAIALNSTMFNVARLIGPAIGGSVAAFFGEGWCFLIKSLTYVPALIVFIRLRVGMTTPAPQQSFFAEMARGFRFIRSSSTASRTLFLVGICSFTSVPYFSFLPMLTDTMLHENASVAGMLMSLTGIGSVVAAVLLTIQGTVEKLRYWPLWSSVLLGLAQIGIGFSTSTPVTSLLAIPVGFAILSQNLASNTTLQYLAPPDLRGRIMAFYSMMMMGTVPLGSLVTGALADWIGLPLTAIIGGVLCAGSALLLAIVTRKSAV